MYRKLLNKRLESIDRSRRGKNSTHSSSGKYAEGVEMLRSQFSELQMLTADQPDLMHYGSGQNIVIDRRMSQRPTNFTGSIGGATAKTTVLPKAASIQQSTSVFTPMPENIKHNLSSYNVVKPDNSSQKVLHSGYESILGLRQNQLSNSKDAARFDKGLGILRAPVKEKHVSQSRINVKQETAIERVSQRQSKSITKLQNRLKYTDSMKTTEKFGSSRFAAQSTTNDNSNNDYVDVLNQTSQATNSGFISSSNISIPRIPKKVVMISEKQTTPEKSNKLPSSPSQLKMLQTSAAYEQKISATKASILKQHQRQQQQQAHSNYLQTRLTTDGGKTFSSSVPSTYRQQNDSSMNGSFPQMLDSSSRGKMLNKTPNVIKNKKIPSNLLQQHKSPLQSQSPKSRQKKSHRGSLDNSDLHQEVQILPQPISQNKLQQMIPLKQPKNARPSGQKGQRNVAEDRDASLNLANCQPKLEKVIRQRQRQRQGSNAAQTEEHMDASHGVDHNSSQQRTGRAQGAYRTAGFEFKQGGMVGDSYLTTGHLHVQQLPSESGQFAAIMNQEQRNQVDQMIDQLDLQEAIRQKAKAFFNKEQNRLLEQTSQSVGNVNPAGRRPAKDATIFMTSEAALQTAGDHTQHFGLSSVNKNLSKAKQLVQGRNIDDYDACSTYDNGGGPRLERNKKKAKFEDKDAESEQELLENVYSERIQSSQSNIRRKLDKMMKNQHPRNMNLELGGSDEPMAHLMSNSLEADISRLLDEGKAPQIDNRVNEISLRLHDDSIQQPDLEQENLTVGSSVYKSIAALDLHEIKAGNTQKHRQSSVDNQLISIKQTQQLSSNKSNYMLARSSVAADEENLQQDSCRSDEQFNNLRRQVLRGPTKKKNSQEFEEVQGLSMDQMALMEVSRKFKSAQKQKLAQTMYNSRVVSPRHKLASFKQDHSKIILGQYRFGMNQHKPKSMDPNAPANQRFSQMASHRFAKTNEKFMELYDKQLMEYRKTRRFLAKEINKSPEMKRHADLIMSQSPLHQKMQNKIKLQLIDETIKEELQEALQTPSQKESRKSLKGLKQIQKYNKNQKNEKQINKELNSPSNVDKQLLNSVKSVNSGSTIRRMNMHKEEAYESLLFGQSVASPISNSVNDFYINHISPKEGVDRQQKGFILNNGLDIHEDFASDASDDKKLSMKKATYEMDQLVTDCVFQDDALKMGLSLYFKEQENEQKSNFKVQQRQLLNYLNILFGGNNQANDYIAMAKNLTKQLKRQDTGDSHGKQRAEEIFQEQTNDLGIDDADINTEIVGLLAGEILKKTAFFDLYKSNSRGKQAMIQESQMIKQYEQQAKQHHQMTVALLSQKKQDVLKDLLDLPANAKGAQGAQKVLDSISQFNRINSLLITDPMHKDNFLKNIVKTTQPDAHFDSEMTNDSDVQSEMAKANFIKQCEKNMVVTLPLLLRIKNKKMILERYQLNNGLCQALAISFMCFKEIANDFHLNSNNLSDDDFAVLLRGMSQLKNVSRLSYNHNSFGHKSLHALIPILCNGGSAKNSLRELHFKHCKMSAKVTNDLLLTLNQNRNFIRCLSLVNVNLNQSNYRELIQLIRSSRQLQELDISWNGMRCHQMYEIIDVLSENRTLQDLNLSYNNLHDSMQEKFCESTPDELIKNQAIKSKLEMQMKRAKTQAAKAAAEYEAMDNSMKHIMKLIRFIKMNSNLMHLNLSGMGMNQSMMHQFGRAMRRTKSLVSLHLSQNNGDSENLRGHLVARGHIRIFEPIFRPDFNQMNNLEYKPDKNDKFARKREFKLENSIIFGPKDQEDRRIAEGKSKISEQLNLKNMLKNKRGSVNRQQVENDANEMLVFNRYLGHKTELPGSGQWRMLAPSNDIQERCWVCNLEVYTLIFWSRNFGLKHQKELYRHGIDEMAYENQLFEIEERNTQLGITIDFLANEGNPQLHEQGHKAIGYPYVYNEYNNWKPQRMYTIEEFCYIMDKNRPNILKNLKRGNFVREEVESRDQMNKKERLRYDVAMKQLMNKYHKLKNWRKLLGIHARYKKPFLANAEALLLNSNKPVNIAKMDEELAPSDSESDFGTASESDSMRSDELEQEGEAGANELNNIEEVDSMVSLNMEDQGVTSAASPLMKSNYTFSKSLAATQHRRQLNLMKEKVKMNRQLYVMPCFLKPGKQTFVIQSQMYETDIQTCRSSKKNAEQMMHTAKNNGVSPQAGSILETNNDTDEQFYFHEVLAPQRRERIPLFQKALVRKELNEAEFDRNATVFKDWKPPTDRDLAKMLDHDKELWKLPRFIKEEKQLKEVYDCFYSNIRKLFYVFITISATSNFPGITWLDFTKFAESCNIVNKAQGVNQADVDRYFLASAGEMAGQGCYRYQFFEAIMRVADLKYLKSGLATSYAEAFQMFLDQNCFLLGPTSEWQDFRDKVWWCYETHKILMANQRHLVKIYRSFFAPRKKCMCKNDCVELMSKTTKIIPDENKVSYCYGMSKMHLVLETTQKQQYDEMKYVEFLEFIGRCAHAKFCEEDDHIAEKLKMLLDELFPSFGVQRIEVEEEEAEMSESDPDY